MAKDILMGADGDVSIINGDFNVGNSDEQHIEDILTARKGEYKNAPITGVDLFSFLNAPVTLVTRQKMEKEIAMQMKLDNASNISVDTSAQGDLKVVADYE